MNSCSCCGKIIFGNSIISTIGSKTYYFCSEKCKNALLSRNNMSTSSGMVSTSSNFNSDKSYKAQKRKISQKSGTPSKIVISGAEYSFDGKTDRVTMKIKSIVNESDEMTGNLRIELFLSKSGPYKRGIKLEGGTIAVSSEYDALRAGYSYNNVVSTVLKKSAMKTGKYLPIFFVKELNEDGLWHIAGFLNFMQIQKWIF